MKRTGTLSAAAFLLPWKFEACNRNLFGRDQYRSNAKWRVVRQGTESFAVRGVFAASDVIAIGAIRALVKAGRRVPGDVSVVGYDNIPAARLVTPQLTTIDQDTNLAGRMLVSKLIDTKGGQAISERLETSLLIRESCGG